MTDGIAETIGLTSAEAERRLRAEGPNELPSARRRSVAAILVDVLREPMLLLLIAGGALYLVLGDVQEALILLFFVLVVAGIAFFQERKTERALEALRDLSSPRALVVRDGAQRRIAGREVVRGDAVLLAEGDRVPADAIVVDATGLSVDESLLTGESVPVRKRPSPAPPAEMSRPGGEDTPFVFSGTLVVKGQALAVVLATGAATELGMIGRSLRELEPGRTRLQVEVARLVRVLALAGLALCVLVVVLFGLLRGDWLRGVFAGITLAMAVLPEEFPVVLAVFLAIGAWRLSRRHILTRRMPAIETLGSATVLCVDKTGTLTQNRMVVRQIEVGGQVLRVDDQDALSETFHRIVEYAVLASPVDPFDPMDAAFKALGERFLAQTEHLHADWTLVREYALSEELLALSHVWRSPGGDEYVIAAKGAPEAIADLCHLDEAQSREFCERVAGMADKGLRVLGVAAATFTVAEGLPGQQHDFAFRCLGLLGLEDPIRETVPDSIAEAYSAGIRVVMITGDYPGTARAIGRSVGLRDVEDVVTGAELSAMDDAALAERTSTVDLFARVVPEQKLRIVQALQARGEIVAMTGDGVNDAPALKAADIGVAMGAHGTDVAREAADLVVTDDDFSSIVGAVRGGRRVFDNLRKAMAYLFAVHLPIAGMSLLPVLLFRLGDVRWPLVLLPVHVTFLELIIDPACSIVFEAEPEDPETMRRPPRPPDEPLFDRSVVETGVVQGLSVLAVVFAVYVGSLLLGPGRGEGHEEYVRTVTFMALVFSNLALIFVNRSWSRTVTGTLRQHNPALWWVTGAALVVLGVVLASPFLREVFRFAPVGPAEVGVALGAAVLGVVWFELLKALRRQRKVPVLGRP